MRKIFAILLISPLFFLPALGADEPQYTNSSFARLSYLTGNAYLQRAADLAYEEAVLNMPISEGDRLGTTDGRAEVFLGKGNYLRLDNNTKADFLNLPRKDAELTRIKVWSGNAYLRVKSLREEKKIEIHTPDVSLYVLDQGLYRIDVRQNGETEIFVFQGMVEASGETGSVLVKDGQRLEVSNARFTSRPTPFPAVAEDSFDRWSENRDSQLRKYQARYLPEELEDFEYELAEYGDWVYIPPYGYVWAPNSVDIGWHPYFYGRWTWLSLCGWTWIPYEPWGWCTYHFGRWHWTPWLGWYWIPTSIWGPAWVSWYWGYDYFGWVPLSYYGYPGVIINNVYYDHYTGDYPLNSRALTVIHKNQLKARNVSEVALNEQSLKSLGKINLSSQAPSLRPVNKEVSVEKLGGEKLILRKQDDRYEPDRTQRLDQTRIRKSESADSKESRKEGTQRPESSQERKIIKRDSYGYPSSPEISARNYPRKIETRKSSSGLSRIYKYISGRSNSSRASSPSPSSRGSSKKISSSGSSRSHSGAPSRSSSSSSRSSSRSGGVKKKN